MQRYLKWAPSPPCWRQQALCCHCHHSHGCRLNDRETTTYFRYRTKDLYFWKGIKLLLQLDNYWRPTAKCTIKLSMNCFNRIFSLQTRGSVSEKPNRMSEVGQWVSSETVRFGSMSSTLSFFVFGYDVRFKVDPYTLTVTQCALC